MCGIYGTTRRLSDSEVKDKLRLIESRGPDFEGFSSSSDVILGHRRLAILDLDDRSNQPFTYGRVRISFNGEIYNYKSLRKSLLQKGYTFRTEGDTEVLCALYQEHGSKMLSHLQGMFAFVIHDEERQILFGARDRTGQKPLYYSLHNGDFEFASQPSQIALGRNFSENQTSLASFLLLKYIPTGSSAWNEISSLPPGYSFTYQLSNGGLETCCYWSPWDQRVKFRGTYDEALEQLDELFDCAVSDRLASDVPLGVFLSGGVDSSLVAAYAAKASDSQVKTFSVKFSEDGFDESAHALRVAQALGTDHHTIQCNPYEGLGLIEKYTDYYDEPFSDSSAIPSMLLARETKKHVTVALSGDGADEVFLGYKRYHLLEKLKRIYRVPLGIRSGVAKGLSSIAPNRFNPHKTALLQHDEFDLYEGMMSSFNCDFLSTNTDVGFAGILRGANDVQLLEAVSRLEIWSYLANDINTKVDKATMAFSVEARSPFLDYRVLEFGLSLPQDYKFKSNYQKRILKDMLAQELDPALFDRPKSGFSMPFELWFREDLKEFVLDELSDDFLRSVSFLNAGNIRTRISKHMSGHENNFPLIWSLIVLKMWRRKRGK